MAPYGEGAFRIEGGVLTCPSDMNGVTPSMLRDWCLKLIAAPPSSISIDLSSTRHMASHHLGVLAQAWAEAVAKQKQLVVKISPDLRRVFEMAGLDQVLDLSA